MLVKQVLSSQKEMLHEKTVDAVMKYTNIVA